MSQRRHWLRLVIRVGALMLRPARISAGLVTDSYDRIAAGYDDAWTSHMRGLTLAMLERLAPPPGALCLDLACGTGFATDRLAELTGGRVTGVDASAGMLAAARRHYSRRCGFVQADMVDYLSACPARSLDVITCAWGLGYSRPLRVIREAARVLRPGGRLGIIDNTTFSLAEVLWCSLLAFAEYPESLRHAMKVRFLPNAAAAAAAMRFCGLGVVYCRDGSRTYHVPGGRQAVERLIATGAAAGFEFAAAPEVRERVFARFAEILEQRYRTPEGVPITHRYLEVTSRLPGAEEDEVARVARG